MTLVDLAKLKLRDNRLRENLGNLDNLQTSMEQIGQIHSILADENWFIRVGTRRYICAGRLGWDQIEVDQRKGVSEDEWIIIEAHENIKRKNLDTVEEAVALSKSKEAYQRLHPETVKGVAGGLASGESRAKRTTDKLAVVHKKPEKPTDKIPSYTKSFVKSEAEQQGVSERTIARKIALGDAIREKKIDEEIIEKVRKKEVSRHAALRQLREERSRKGFEAAQRAIEEEKSGILPVPDDGMNDYDEDTSIGELMPIEQIDAMSEFTVDEAEEDDDMISGINEVRKELGFEEFKMCEDCAKADVLYCPECECGIVICKKLGTLRLFPLDTEACKEEDGFEVIS